MALGGFVLCTNGDLVNLALVERIWVDDPGEGGGDDPFEVIAEMRQGSHTLSRRPDRDSADRDVAQIFATHGVAVLDARFARSWEEVERISAYMAEEPDKPGK